MSFVNAPYSPAAVFSLPVETVWPVGETRLVEIGWGVGNQVFPQVAFRKKTYRSIEELQQDLDVWINHYNARALHQGKMCCGRTPLITVLARKEVRGAKVAALNWNLTWRSPTHRHGSDQVATTT